ncbi:hypothetical protein HMPREF1316_0406 [Olsenella profusa F0195]|uniref:Uncharacterized protein n=2 Tax=Olsenella profusa TaxID=138595 RepID=U2UZY4_9ACTN|nr:hypothetical protein HMPREF1316_0406 [Olsenella profusa F0195]
MKMPSRKKRTNGSPYQAAARQYYIDLQDGTYTRANKFLNNNGGDVNVINQLYTNLSQRDMAALVKQPVSISGEDMSKDYSTKTEEQKKEIMNKEIEIIGSYDNLSDTSRFIQSLRDGDNDLP